MSGLLPVESNNQVGIDIVRTRFCTSEVGQKNGNAEWAWRKAQFCLRSVPVWNVDKVLL